MPQQMDDTHAIKEARETLPGCQIWPSTVSLDVQLCSFSHGMVCVDILWLDCH
jgi:hypothetical protein